MIAPFEKEALLTADKSVASKIHRERNPNNRTCVDVSSDARFQICHFVLLFPAHLQRVGCPTTLPCTRVKLSQNARVAQKERK